MKKTIFLFILVLLTGCTTKKVIIADITYSLDNNLRIYGEVIAKDDKDNIIRFLTLNNSEVLPNKTKKVTLTLVFAQADSRYYNSMLELTTSSTSPKLTTMLDFKSGGYINTLDLPLPVKGQEVKVKIIFTDLNQRITEFGEISYKIK